MQVLNRVIDMVTHCIQFIIKHGVLYWMRQAPGKKNVANEEVIIFAA